jgi:hypothetical protein
MTQSKYMCWKVELTTGEAAIVAAKGCTVDNKGTLIFTEGTQDYNPKVVAAFHAGSWQTVTLVKE